jgi:hypothetical protein
MSQYSYIYIPNHKAVPMHVYVLFSLANTLDHRAAPEQYDGADSVNHGLDDADAANQFRPYFESDLDHQGATRDSTNHGPHHTNIANKLDPLVDSDQDHRANLGPSNYGPQSSNVANKLNSRYDSDLDHREPDSINCKRSSYCVN